MICDVYSLRPEVSGLDRKLCSAAYVEVDYGEVFGMLYGAPYSKIVNGTKIGDADDTTVGEVDGT